MVINLSLFMINACSNITPTLQNTELVQEDLQNLQTITKIEVYQAESWSSEEKKILNTIETPDLINTATQFFEAQAEHWEYPPYLPYAPPGLIEIHFFENDKLKTFVTLGYAGKNPTESRRFYLSKPLGPLRYLSQNEFKKLIEVLELDEETNLEILKVPASYDTTNKKATTS